MFHSFFQTTFYIKEMLGEDLLCPVCLDHLSPPVVQCRSGHNTCLSCKKDFQKCPLCRDPFVETTNRMLNRILNLLSSSSPCLYASKGCNSMFSEDHKTQFCPYRSVKCPQCPWKNLARNWLMHVDDKHFNRGVLLVDTPLKLSAESCIRFFNSGSVYRVGDRRYFFCLRSTSAEGRMLLDVVYVPLKEQPEQNLFQIEFKDQINDITVDSFLVKPGAIALKNENGMSFFSDMVVDRPTYSVLITAIKV